MLIYFINIDAKILNKILATNPTTHKNIIYHDEVGFILISHGCFNQCKSVNLTHHINKRKVKKLHDHLNSCRKATVKIQNSFMLKTPTKVVIEGIYLK